MLKYTGYGRKRQWSNLKYKVRPEVGAHEHVRVLIAVDSEWVREGGERQEWVGWRIQ